MKPIIFGGGYRQLYGVFHPAQSARRRHSAVLLCYPHVTEYNFVHRAYRQIAIALSAEGFDAFRFDYSGTGDSAGDVDQFGFKDWIEDISTAAAELKDLARVSEISIVGRQLGATLACRAITTGLAVKRAVLWEPVLDGRNFVEGLEQAHRDGCVERLQPYSDGEKPWRTLLGFPFPIQVRQDTESIRLTKEIPADLEVGILMSPRDAEAQTYELFKQWVATTSGKTKLLELMDVPKFLPGSAREAIVPAGPVPARIAAMLTERWDSE
jgi:alpha-beta hydrolase superfamily lysophospholipase